MVRKISKTAAHRIVDALAEADRGNYPRSALFYVSREDVENVTLDYLKLLDSAAKDSKLLERVDLPLTSEPVGQETTRPETRSYSPYEVVPREAGGWLLSYKDQTFGFHRTKEEAEAYARRLIWGYDSD